MPILKLTPRGVAALATDRPQQDFWDEKTPGLAIRVTKHGRKTYVVRYRANGFHRRWPIGRHPSLTLAAARKEARRVLADVQAGGDPALEREQLRSGATTFEALAREVLEAKAERTRRRTREERERMLEKELLPSWSNRPAASITRRDVVGLVEAIVSRGSPVAANRTLRLIQLLFNEGLRRGFPTLESNPAHMMQLPGQETRRRRFLSVAEIRTVWRALEPENLHTQAVFRLAMLTGQRIGSVCAMRWRDIDAADAWTIPAETFKGRRVHLVPLSAEALAVLSGLPEWQEYVFPSRADAEAPHMSSTGPALQRIRARTDKLDMPHWTAHDFRRTFRTHATRPECPDHPKDPGGLGVRPEVADAVLGHKEASLGFDTYTGEQERYLLSEKRGALRRWGAFIREAVEVDE